MVSYTWGRNIMKKHFLSTTNWWVLASSLRVHFHDIPLTHYWYKVETWAHYSSGSLVVGPPSLLLKIWIQEWVLITRKDVHDKTPKCVMGSNKMCLGRRYVWQGTKVCLWAAWKICLGIIHLFEKKKMNRAKGRLIKGKKEANNSFVLVAISTHC
jgi:hypothetical protein